ncbi:MAG: NUDIX domain-containing protein [Verrucomicrobia bacterium]|nr:MAG: NUDIX domain-containing protein [Verrucomicrobiota bacterium]
MHRSPLLTLLRRYRPIDTRDTRRLEAFTRFVTEHPDCFERTLAIGHVTGSAWIIDRSGKRVLLTHHRKLDIWVQPGGHADGDPDIFAVALREAREETGLDDLAPQSNEIFDLDIHTIPARGDIPEHLHYDVRFALRATGSEDFAVSEESHALAWVELADLERFSTEASLLRMRRKWHDLAHSAHPLPHPERSPATRPDSP